MPRKPGRRPWLLALFALLLLAMSGWLLVRGEQRQAVLGTGLAAAEDRLEILDPAAPAGGTAAAVFVQGQARVVEPPKDPLLGVTAVVLRLDRLVEMLQWREHVEGSGEDRTVLYEPVWSATLIDSSRFHQRLAHANPGSMPIPPASFPAPGARLGRLNLAPEVLAALPAEAAVAADPAQLARRTGRSFTRAGEWLYTGDPQAPAVGDLRLRFAAAPAGEISVLAGLEGAGLEGAGLEGDVLVPWPAPGGGMVALAAPGLVEPATLVGEARRRGWLEAWKTRLGGGFLAVVAMLMARAGLGIGRQGPVQAVAGALLAATGFSLACIGAGWLLFRPLAEAGLLLAAAGAAGALALLAFRHGNQRA